MCVSYIFTKIYMYIHTHLFLQLVEWWLGIVAPIWDDIEKLLAGSIGCSPLADVSLCVYLCVFTDTVWEWVFENHRKLHILDLSIESPSPKWLQTSFSSSCDLHFLGNTCTLGHGQDLLQLVVWIKDTWSGPWAILMIGLFRKQCLTKPFWFFPSLIFDLGKLPHL